MKILKILKSILVILCIVIMGVGGFLVDCWWYNDAGRFCP